jgi:glutamyl-Q tRNA(Asp) synthetase
MSITTRFAPSPTGLLHLGHAHAALFAWHHARRAGGRFLLRLEDIDATRCRPEYATAIAEDLAWLGLDWDGEVRVQSQHMAAYQRMIEVLDDLVYPCFCTRSDILREVAQAGAAPHGPDGAPIYPGTCRALSADIRNRRIDGGAAYALRLDVTRAAAGRHLWFEEIGEGRVACDPTIFGDVVIARRDVPASYHLCVTHDDALQGVTLVTRANDLKPATALHRLLQEIMRWPAPTYAHHALLTDEKGARLSKRAGAPTLRGLREQGISLEAVQKAAGFANP